MSAQSRERLDLEYADMAAFLDLIRSMNKLEKDAHGRHLVVAMGTLRRANLLDGLSLLACLVSLGLAAFIALSVHNTPAALLACLLPICAMRLLAVYELSRDTFYGTGRQLIELQRRDSATDG